MKTKELTLDKDIFGQPYVVFVLGLGRIHPKERERIIVLLPNTLLQQFSLYHDVEILVQYQKDDIDSVSNTKRKLHKNWGSDAATFCDKIVSNYPTAGTWTATFVNDGILEDVDFEFDVDIKNYKVIRLSTVDTPSNIAQNLQKDLKKAHEILKKFPSTEPTIVEVHF